MFIGMVVVVEPPMFFFEIQVIIGESRLQSLSEKNILQQVLPDRFAMQGFQPESLQPIVFLLEVLS